MINGKKIAIVCSGGGMRCSYSAGALYALVKEFEFYGCINSRIYIFPSRL